MLDVFGPWSGLMPYVDLSDPDMRLLENGPANRGAAAARPARRARPDPPAALGPPRAVTALRDARRHQPGVRRAPLRLLGRQATSPCRRRIWLTTKLYKEALKDI